MLAKYLILRSSKFLQMQMTKNDNFMVNSSPVFEVQAWISIHAFHGEGAHRNPSIWHFHVRVTPCVSHFAFAPTLCKTKKNESFCFNNRLS